MLANCVAHSLLAKNWLSIILEQMVESLRLIRPNVVNLNKQTWGWGDRVFMALCGST